MIVFHKIRWKNFLATGNHFLEVNLSGHTNTLIVGSNGSGKSTLLDALSFVLYGKSYRNINRPQLINSIIGKGCLVEVEFTTNQKSYLVRRGMKPGVFEVYEDEILLNQDSTTKDYQDSFEKNILRHSHKSFSQVVVLGSSSYVPFMRLPAQSRREVIEDLLDLEIFSAMNLLLRDRMVHCRSRLQEIGYQIKSKEREIDLIQKMEAELEAASRQEIETRETERLQKEAAVRVLDGKIKTIEETLEIYAIHEAKIREYDIILKKLEHGKQHLQAQKRRYLDTQRLLDRDSCPTCLQKIDDTFRSKEIETIRDQIDNIDKTLTTCETHERTVKAKRDDEKLSPDRDTVLGALHRFRGERNSLVQDINSLSDEIKRRETQRHNIDTAKYETMVHDLTRLRAEEIDENLNSETLNTAAILLKDGGIKAKIIRQYVPVINKVINRYLSKMNFSIHFELNERFEETIKSRHRDDFSYESFSEGERTRIDLALLFAWRHLSRLRSPSSINLLIMDEIFDGSLDSDGTDDLMDTIKDIESGSNVFVISHKDQWATRFENVLGFSKVKNFTQIEGLAVQ